MIELIDTRTPYLEDFSRLEKDLVGNGLDWLDRIRHSAMTRFSELGIPTTQEEDWRFTDLTPLRHTTFTPMVEHPLDGLHAADLVGFTFSALESYQLVFVNGVYAHELSSVGTLPGSSVVGSLAAALQGDPTRLKSHLAGQGSHLKRAFAALNTAFFQDGAFVCLPKGTALNTPIHLLFLSRPLDKPTIAHPRVLIVAEADVQATVVETYGSLGKEVSFTPLPRKPRVSTRGGRTRCVPGGSPGGHGCEAVVTGFTNAVTEIVVGENARIGHVKLQRESDAAIHMADIQVHQERNSRFTSHSFSWGGALVRNDLNVVLAAEGADCTLNGLYRVTGQQHVDHHTTIDHTKPHGTSRELYKGILDGKARAVFSGTIIVQPDARKTDSLQTNKNLLLSDEALVNTKPELKIFSNDVKCKHGATIGQMSREALFYLRSRGIGLGEARRLLTWAFANEMIDRIDTPSLRDGIAQLVSEVL